MSGEEMRPYVVRQGDYLVRLAWIHGFDAEEVWKHEKNKELAERRKDHNILAPGDVIYLPVKPKEGLPIQKGATNRYVAKVPRTTMRVRFRDSNGPLANARFEVKGAVSAMPTTDGDGVADLIVPVCIAEIDILFPDHKHAFTVRIGHMDPAEEASGVRARLSHLGYLLDVPGFDAVFSSGLSSEDRFAEALRDFQRDNHLEPSGVADDATREALVRLHGS